MKRIAKDLIDQFPDGFTGDFNSNKELMDALTNVSSRKLRYKIAGYATNLISLTQSSEESSKARAMES